MSTPTPESYLLSLYESLEEAIRENISRMDNPSWRKVLSILKEIDEGRKSND